MLRQNDLTGFFEDDSQTHRIIGEMMMPLEEDITDIIERINDQGGIHGIRLSNNIFFHKDIKGNPPCVSVGEMLYASLCVGDILPDTFPDKEKQGKRPVRIVLHKNIPYEGRAFVGEGYIGVAQA
jgi:hypothetical protein